MNTEWLRYYVVVAETLNLQAAADRLHLTPQAVSKALMGLESQLGVTLVERNRRIEGLTPAGAAFVAEARRLLADLEDARRRMAEWRDDTPRGPVAIAGDGLWHHYLLPPLLAKLKQRCPEVVPQLHEMLPDDVERWVAEGAVDVGLLLRSPVRSDLAWHEGLATPYVIAGRPQPKGHWQDFGYIVPRIFQRELASPLDGWPEGRFPRRIAAEVELVDAAIRLCEAGVGVAFLPELAVAERVAAGTLAVVAEPPVTFEDRLFVVWRKGVRPHAAAREVLGALGAPH